MAKPTSTDATRWKQISPLIDELMEPEAGARLAELTQGDAALARDLRAFFAANQEPQRGAFLEGSAVAGSGMPAIAETLARRRIGKYTLDRAIGQGGMSTVWLAHRSDGRHEGQVAIRVLDLALLVRTGPERFEREGNLLARLAHPHIAHLIDAGVAEGAQPYLVLEYIEGEPIEQWCDARGLDVRARIRTPGRPRSSRRAETPRLPIPPAGEGWAEGYRCRAPFARCAPIRSGRKGRARPLRP
jgi:hypothetical protein